MRRRRRRGRDGVEAHRLPAESVQLLRIHKWASLARRAQGPKLVVVFDSHGRALGQLVSHFGEEAEAAQRLCAVLEEWCPDHDTEVM
jgi:hypothetical protein